ncbi:MAG: SDR family NAD(P)-dependent oxidoreductase [Alphaproteobacteria bacterium]|nr:SDR family oxidoreductase [Rhodobiaceae bacterium]|tara:strand:- start:28 stop:810 length:783 start_codon:yes stop_codon:yes gene_type:complete
MENKLFDLSEKVSVITGGNGGIGLGIAEGLASSGCNVAILGRNEEKNQLSKDLLNKFGTKIETYKVDVSKESDVKNTISKVVNDFGRIDSVFANAGVNIYGGSFENMDTDVYRKVLSVNLDGVFFTLRETCKHMVERAKNGDPGGSVVGIASLAGIEGAAKTQPYSASKGGVRAMIKGITVEHARYGIRANTIVPGWIATDMTNDSQNSEKFTNKVISRVPMRRWGEPKDFAGIAVYLASDSSSYHSGDSFVVDGGYAIF